MTDAVIATSPAAMPKEDAHSGDAPDSLRFPPRVLDYLHNERRLSDRAIDQFNLAWDANKRAIVVPIEGGLVKFHRGPRTGKPKMWWRTLTAAETARPRPPYPSWSDLRDPDCEVLVGGEFDAMCAIGHGVLAVSGTLGEPTFTEEWGRAVVEGRGRKPLPILLDRDEAGDRGALLAARMITESGGIAAIAKWPDDRPEGWDITDHFKSGGSAEQLRAIIAQAVPFVATMSIAAEVGGLSEVGGLGVFDPDAVGRAFGEEPPPDRPQDGPVLITLSEVAPEPVTWLWPGRVPSGRLTLYVGDPGVGKSYLSLDAAARVTTGTAWPDGTPCPRGRVVLLSAEDGLADTVVPRLLGMGADLSRVMALTAVREQGRERQFSLATDIQRLEQAARQTDDDGDQVRLVVIDPVGAYIGAKTDSHKDADVRQVLAPLARLAERYGFAVLAVMHLNKGNAKSLYRVLASIGFVGAARAVFAVAGDPAAPESTRTIFAPLKMNLGPRPPVLAFSIEVPAGVKWEAEPIRNFDIEAALRGPDARREPTPRQEAQEFLRSELADGRRPTAEIKDEALAAGISERTLERAKAALGVRAVHDQTFGRDGRWDWELTDAPRPPHVAKAATSGDSAAGAGRDNQVGDGPMAEASLEVFHPCRSCGGTEHWRRPDDGKLICGRCHPSPMPWPMTQSSDTAVSVEAAAE